MSVRLRLQVADCVVFRFAHIGPCIPGRAKKRMEGGLGKGARQHYGAYWRDMAFESGEKFIISAQKG